MRTTIVVGCLILFGCTAAQAQDCKTAQAAYAAGNYEQAKAILQPLASRGDDCAQYQLGEMYMQGRGVPTDKVKALELFKQAAAKGNEKARLMVTFLERK